MQDKDKGLLLTQGQALFVSRFMVMIMRVSVTINFIFDAGRIFFNPC